MNQPCPRVPCPNFDGTWAGDPLLEPQREIAAHEDEDPEWFRKVTDRWKKHPILRSVDEP